ncbi:gastrula zinc finger protein XlCGF49.1-like isoform X3 [Poecilia formosa]|uniref:gastrula zinc finger protein XlCGF49.1-like isoform X3 n=1 Tax=Poecilia formosa TaxID=48698 RepID=UPI0004439450|nr:PREDICTED: gastrula zinc finger protein XlCGF49.1-like isoform X3 [Poecilia formosa]
MEEPAHDVQQLMGIKEEENWSPKPDQEDQKPPQIKEEQQENEITELPFNPVPVKSEDDEEKPQFPELHLSQTEKNRDLVRPELDQCLKSVCSKAFTLKTNLEKHTKIHGFKTRNTLVEHTITHVTERPFSCSVCSQSFNCKSHLSAHMCGNTGKKPYSCLVCGKTFAYLTSLKCHLRRHTGGKL